MMKKYRCEKCSLVFDSVGQYINHLDLHSDALVDIPETTNKKQTFWDKLFGKEKNKYKYGGESGMVKEDGELSKVEADDLYVKKEDFDTVKEKISGMENTLDSLHNLVRDLLEKSSEKDVVSDDLNSYEPIEKEEKYVNDTLNPIFNKRQVRISIKVMDKDVPNLLRAIQENGDYELEEIGVLK